MDLRGKANAGPCTGPGKGVVRPLINLLSITDQCNCECPRVLRCCRSHRQSHASSDRRDSHAEVVEKCATRASGRFRSPAANRPFHPDLPAVVPASYGNPGCEVLIATNGLPSCGELGVCEAFEKERSLEGQSSVRYARRVDPTSNCTVETGGSDAKIQAAHQRDRRRVAAGDNYDREHR